VEAGRAFSVIGMIRDLVPLLCALCEMDPPEVTDQAIQDNPEGSALGSLYAMGALIHVGNSECILCLECDQPHSIRVEFAGEGNYRAYCPDSGYQVVRPDALRRFAVDERWIAKSIGSKFNLGEPRRSSAVAPSAVLQIGGARLGPYKFGLFFARRLFDKVRFDQASQSISRLLGKASAVLLTTTPRDLIPGQPLPGAQFLRWTTSSNSLDAKSQSMMSQSTPRFVGVPDVLAPSR
jgi:hypothetical protein